jgi:hypothetical protein
MSKLMEVIADALHDVLLDPRLTPGEQQLLTDWSMSLDGFAEGMSVFKYHAMMEALADADDAAVAKRRALEAPRASKRQPRSQQAGSERTAKPRAAARTRSPRRRAA